MDGNKKKSVVLFLSLLYHSLSFNSFISFQKHKADFEEGNEEEMKKRIIHIFKYRKKEEVEGGGEHS